MPDIYRPFFGQDTRLAAGDMLKSGTGLDRLDVVTDALGTKHRF